MKISRVVLILSFVSLLADVASELLYPVMPVYLKSIGYSFIAIGLLEGIANVVAGIAKGYFGKLSDKRGERSVFVKTGYGFSALGKGLLLISSSLPIIYLSRLTDRLGKGIRTAPRDAILASESTDETRAAVFGFHRAMDTTGAVIGPVIGLVWLYFYPGNYKGMFMIAVFPAVASWLLTLIVKDKSIKEKPVVSLEKKGGFFSHFGYWNNAKLEYKSLVGTLLFFALVNSPDVFLLLTIKAAGFSDQAMIVAYVFYNLIYALLSYPVGKLADKIGRMKVLIVGVLLFVVTYIGMAYASSLISFLILFMIYAMSMACTESVVKAIISGFIPDNERGTAIGFYSSTSSIAALIAGAWTGWIFGAYGIKAAFLVTAAGALISMIVLIVKMNDVKQNKIKL